MKQVYNLLKILSTIGAMTIVNPIAHAVQLSVDTFKSTLQHQNATNAQGNEHIIRTMEDAENIAKVMQKYADRIKFIAGKNNGAILTEIRVISDIFTLWMIDAIDGQAPTTKTYLPNIKVSVDQICKAINAPNNNDLQLDVNEYRTFDGQAPAAQDFKTTRDTILELGVNQTTMNRSHQNGKNKLWNETARLTLLRQSTIQPLDILLEMVHQNHNTQAPNTINTQALAKKILKQQIKIPTYITNHDEIAIILYAAKDNSLANDQNWA